MCKHCNPPSILLYKIKTGHQVFISMILMKHWTISQKPATDMRSSTMLVYCHLPIIYTSLCTEKTTRWFQKYCCIQCLEKYFWFILTISYKFMLFWEKQQHEAMPLGLDLSCVPFTCSSDNVQGKQNYIWISKYKAKHTHYIYKYLNTCNKNKREVNMSNILTVISLAQLASCRIRAATVKRSSMEFLNIIILLEQ